MKKLLILIASISVLFACSSTKEKKICNEVSTRGNLGILINSVDDEPLVKDVDGNLVFITNDEQQHNVFQIRDRDILLTNLDNITKQNGLISPGLPTSYAIDSGKTLYVISGLTNDSLNRDLFAFLYVRGEYARKIDISLLNGKGFEGHPYFSKNKLYFTKEADSSWDIYSSIYSNNSWSAPEPVSGINTNEDEGFYSESGNKSFFARRINGKFNIFSVKNDTTGTKQIYPLSYEFNSESNDISPVLHNGKLYLSSDRAGGCGKFDIYEFDFCRNVSLSGNVVSEFENVPLKGTVELYSEDSTLVSQYVIPNNSSFNFDLAPNQYYYLVYKNDCYNTVKSTDLFFAECSENADVVLHQDIYLPNYTVEFNFEEYDIPFFVTGYYRPNTSDNLTELKNLFKSGVITGKGNTSYIEYPTDKYAQYALTIDSAFDSAINYINDKLSNIHNECVKADTKIVLDITGYSDPREIAPGNVYPGPDIYDGNGATAVKHGEAINNHLLSFIRAYYTGEYIKNKVKDSSKIILNMFTGGVDIKKDRPNDMKRRVKISIRLKTAEN
jgi:hypothetical protein